MFLLHYEPGANYPERSHPRETNRISPNSHNFVCHGNFIEADHDGKWYKVCPLGNFKNAIFFNTFEDAILNVQHHGGPPEQQKDFFVYDVSFTKVGRYRTFDMEPDILTKEEQLKKEKELHESGAHLVLQNFAQDLLENMKPLDPEFAQIINDNLEELLVKYVELHEPTTDKTEKEKESYEFQNLLENMKPLDPDFSKTVDDNFFDLMVTEEDIKPNKKEKDDVD